MASIIDRLQATAGREASRQGTSLATQMLPEGAARDGAVTLARNLATGKKVSPAQLREIGANTFNRQSIAGQEWLAEKLTGQKAAPKSEGLRKPPQLPKMDAISPYKLQQPSIYIGDPYKDQLDLFNQLAQVGYSWTNAWMIRVLQPNGDRASFMNLLAVDVGFTPFSAPASPVPLGSANMDGLSGTDPVEIRLTTYDDRAGTIRRWFSEKQARVANRDGTFGLPVDYLFRVEIITSVSTDKEYRSPDNKNAPLRSFLVRAGSIEETYSRREQQLQELNITLVQGDSWLVV